ncbi:hypothetical protein G6F66_013395 [Rhizopus arrhizus]|nr:hypothetical protein G6F66_013395 [Rhizopus arrhizus]
MDSQNTDHMDTTSDAPSAQDTSNAIVDNSDASQESTSAAQIGLSSGQASRKPQSYLVKTNDTQKQSQYVRYLRSLQFNLMAFQETHVTDTHIQTINMQFQATQSLWTYHCDLLSFSPSFVLSENLTPSNPRMVLSKVSHSQNLYAPASSGKARREFFDSVLDTLTSPDYAIDHQQLIILGDFNYSDSQNCPNVL